MFPDPPPYTFIYNTHGNYSGNPMFGPGPANKGNPDNYTFTSLGPSRQFDSGVARHTITYDPTNGTISPGDIHLSGGSRVEL